jgi:hypothetical protein
VEDCKDWLKESQCFASASGSYKDFNSYAFFYFKKVEIESPDSEQKIIQYRDTVTFEFSERNEICYPQNYIGLSNIPLNKNDTVYIDDQYTNYNFKDYDAIIETYHPYMVEPKSNWLIIDNIDKDTTIIEGRFQISFITSYSHYLNNENKRWDDPDRPNILSFKNGKFRAVLMKTK